MNIQPQTADDVGPLESARRRVRDEIFLRIDMLRNNHLGQLLGSESKTDRWTGFGPVACVVCDEVFTKGIYRMPCTHWHCNECLKNNARIALASNPFTPAKCCQVIAKEEFLAYGSLTADEAAQYGAKMEELTNPRHALYCWAEDCGKFIPQSNRKRRVGECAECGKKTCKTCRARSHFGACDKATVEALKAADEEVYRLAESKGWKRCPNCLSIVQKGGGCNHMTCNCGQDFCYRCGQVFSGTTSHVCGPVQ